MDYQLYKMLNEALREAEKTKEVKRVVKEIDNTYWTGLMPYNIYKLMLRRASLKLKKILEKLNP